MKRVYVGLSGGVDSSVSAALLKADGFDVVGVYMKNWTQDVGGVACPWAEDLRDARAAAAVLDIPFKVFDFQSEYKKQVVDVMVSEYAAGRTPNPDVLCNQDIKFNLFLSTALADGADMIATGHYARTRNGSLLEAVDTDKDQTYFLYRVTHEALQHTLFPVGELRKPEVRALATKFGLSTATKPDSQGICFVGEVGMKAFLSEYVSAVTGPVIFEGKQIGTHDGAIFYTIGQRHGLGIGGGKRYFVTGKDMTSNSVFVTNDASDLNLEGSHFELSDTTWIEQKPKSEQQVTVRLRHRGRRIPAKLIASADRWTVQLESSERALASGQSAVVYADGVCLGGGIIEVPHLEVSLVQ
jgi:tRNA-specific 2-thiouridylase